jgi:hypothetical protein
MQAVIALLTMSVFVMLFGLIFRGMGYSPATGILMIIPVINLIWLFHLASSDWPIHRQLADLSGRDDRSPEDYLALMFKRAEMYERRGEYAEALNEFQLLSDELAGKPGAHFAAHWARRIRQRLEAA